MTVIEKEIKFQSNKSTNAYHNISYKDIPILRDKIVCYCMENFPLLVDSMQKTTHTNPHSGPHTHHHEGSVWSHTLMIMTFIEATDLIPNPLVRKRLMIAAFFHDIGKFYTQTMKNRKYTFRGHEGVSTILAVPYLTYMKQDFDLSDLGIEVILNIINFHRYENILLGEYGSIINMFRYFDSMGAVKYISENHNIDPYDYKPREGLPVFTNWVYTYVNTPNIEKYIKDIITEFPVEQQPFLLEHNKNYDIDYYENTSKNITILLDSQLPCGYFDDEDNIEVCKKFLFPTKEYGFRDISIKII